jgi:pimeloyl-ACP methyl ester carboxylesterase
MSQVQEIPANVAPILGEGIEECWMDLDGARMRYLRAGSGPPLILLHGLLGYSFSWRYAMPALAPYATVFALDMLGAGFSAAECVSGDASKLWLRRLVLACPVNPYSAHGKRLAPFFGTFFGAGLFRAGLRMSRVQQLYPYWHGRMFGDPKKIPPGSLEGYKAPLAMPGLFEHGLSIVKTWSADLEELERLLPKLAPIPTLLMWGTKDPAVYFSSMEPLARHFSNVQTVVFPGVGHLPYEECPEEFNRALIKFLTQ